MQTRRIGQVIHAIDDDPRFLTALHRSLESTGLTVKSYSRASEFLAQVQAGQSGCVITDLRMPDISGLELQKRLNQQKVRLPIIFITGHGDTASAITAFKNGAADFLEKPFGEKQLLKSVLQALNKSARNQELAREELVVKQRFKNLTPREREVFSLVVSDRPNKEIARDLKISPRTVEHHREHLMLKMQANSQADLITMAVLCGIHELHLQSDDT